MFYDSLPQIDLHGMDREYAIFMIKDFIADSIKLKNFKIIIIHGIGNGILKKAVHEYLKKEKRVEEFKLDFFNPGCTVVFLKKGKN